MQPTSRKIDGAGRTVLLTGATGFVGNALLPALVDAGFAVRCATRDAVRASRRWPDRQWVQADVADRTAVAAALEGCDVAFYLVHDMASGGSDFHRAEIAQAENFVRAAESAGVRRIVYLGGVAGPPDASEHLRSREEVGEVLRSGRVPTVELRASMIIGHGSLSWLIVRDLAARLPFMVLPRWLESRTQPIGIDDVVSALLGAVDVPVEGSAWFDVPGPDVLSGREILERTADVLGVGRPFMVEVPFVTPRLSTHWVRLVTRAEWSVAREIVVGLKDDLLAKDDRFWGMIGHRELLHFEEAARRALAAERREGPVPGAWGVVERAILAARGGARGGSAGRPAAPVVAGEGGRVAAMVLAWALGASFSRTFGIWPSVGITASALGAAALATGGPSLLPALRPSLLQVAIGLVVGLVMALGTWALFPVATAWTSWIGPDVARLYEAFGRPGPVVLLLLLPIVVCCEEIVWRGAVHRVLAKRLDWLPTALAGAALYALAHAPIGSPALVLTCLCVGFCWDLLRSATGSLVAVVVAHLAWDFAVLVLHPLVRIP